MQCASHDYNTGRNMCRFGLRCLPTIWHPTDASRSREHAERCDQLAPGASPGLATRRCRSETSFAGGERQGTFSDRLGSEEKRFAVVLRFEIRVKRENLGCGLSFGHE